MDRVKVCSFRAFCEIYLSCCRAVFSVYTHLQVLLGGICYHFAEQFREFCSMLCFFISSFFIVGTNFRIAFSVRYSRHCKIHADFRALAFKVCSEICKNVFAHTFRNTYHMFRSPCSVTCLLREFLCRCMTNRTFRRCAFTFINITTYLTYKFLHFNCPPFFLYIPGKCR